MHVGVIRSTYKKGDLNQVVKEYKESALPALASHQGSRSGMLLVDHDSGDAISIAIYEAVQAGRDELANFLVLLSSVVCIIVLIASENLLQRKF